MIINIRIKDSTLIYIWTEKSCCNDYARKAFSSFVARTIASVFPGSVSLCPAPATNSRFTRSFPAFAFGHSFEVKQLSRVVSREAPACQHKPKSVALLDKIKDGALNKRYESLQTHTHHGREREIGRERGG